MANRTIFDFFVANSAGTFSNATWFLVYWGESMCYPGNETVRKLGKIAVVQTLLVTRLRLWPIVTKRIVHFADSFLISEWSINITSTEPCDKHMALTASHIFNFQSANIILWTFCNCFKSNNFNQTSTTFSITITTKFIKPPFASWCSSSKKQSLMSTRNSRFRFSTKFTLSPCYSSFQIQTNWRSILKISW